MTNPLLFSRGGGPDLNNPQTFSGTDTSVIFSIPTVNPTMPAGGSTLESVQLQTITISSAISINPVRRCGEARVAQFSRGARSFAGSMVFTIIGQDPFQSIFGIDTARSSVRTDGSWHIDQMPAFDAIILCQNEMGGVGMQIISNISIVNWGTTYSVDDLYTESTYSYVAEHVSPFIASRFDQAELAAGVSASDISNTLADVLDGIYVADKNPDQLFSETPDHSSGPGSYRIRESEAFTQVPGGNGWNFKGPSTSVLTNSFLGGDWPEGQQ
jgi:hypothetical protein